MKTPLVINRVSDTVTTCLACGSDGVHPILDFGRMPIANGFLSRDEFNREPFFNLRTGYCHSCGMFQLTEWVEPTKMFHENYAFYSSTSAGMVHHFGAFAEWVINNYLPQQNPFVVEMGSNDGILLQHYLRNGIRHLGIEPSRNVADEARKKGVETWSEFFDVKLAERIVEKYGQADVFQSANVMCHIPEIHTVADGIHRLLKPEGVLIFEDPYLGDIIRKGSYDQIYDEHAFYFSVRSVSNLFEKHGLYLIDILPQNVHGGSMRYVLSPNPSRRAHSRVGIHQDLEKKWGLDSLDTYHRFAERVSQSRNDLMALLGRLKQEGRRVVGYAATSKSTTVTNYCGITSDLVEYISDTTPIKIGKYSPGVHIPIYSHEHFLSDKPDYTLLFGWNHSEEILLKEKDYSARGGKWILYVPNVHIL